MSRSGAEETLGLSIARTSQQQDSLASRSQLGKLVPSVTGSLRFLNSGSCSRGELESTNSKSFWKIEESDIVGDGTNDSNNAIELVILILRIAVFREVLDNSGK